MNCGEAVYRPARQPDTRMVGAHRSVRLMVRVWFGMRLGGALETLRQHRQLLAAIGQQLRPQRGVRLAVFEVLRSVLPL